MLLANIGSVWSIAFFTIFFSIVIGIVWAKQEEKNDNYNKSN